MKFWLLFETADYEGDYLVAVTETESEALHIQDYICSRRRRPGDAQYFVIEERTEFDTLEDLKENLG